MLTESRMQTAGIDAVALKPSESDVSRALGFDVETVVIDYEGLEHLPTAETLAALAADVTVRVTMPVRADGFDPLGDDGRWEQVPAAAGRIFVAGHPTYLTPEERRRPVAPRLRAARERDPDAWVGTESVERIALAAGGTQFELLGRTTERDLHALRAAGFDGEIAVYAPTVLTDDENAILDAVGAYAARRRPVREALPEDAPTDAAASGRAREVLSRAARDYALVGDPDEVARRIGRLHEAGADTIVGYPARGLAPSRDGERR
ncbi:MAG: luciferase [Haloarculaceae archaeon]